MKDIALFLISSILTPATLAAGQTACLSPTHIEVANPLRASSTKDLTAISSSNCVARTVASPLHPIAWEQTIAPLLATNRPNTAMLVRILLARVGWADLGRGAVLAPAELQLKYGHSRKPNLVDEAYPGQGSFAAKRAADNAVVWF
jgi:hypothetical protein